MDNMKRQKYAYAGIIIVFIVLVSVIVTFRHKETDENVNKIIPIIQSDFYFLNLSLDYQFDEYLTRPSGTRALSEKKHLAIPPFACSCISVADSEQSHYFGRNFDWIDGKKLLLFTQPPNGYRSFSMVDISTLETYQDFDFSKTSNENFKTLAFSPFDGINEHGLSVAILACEGMDPGFYYHKKTLKSLEFIRLALDHSKTISEALDLWEQYNIQFSPGPIVHFMIADSTGESVIVEWIDGYLTPIYNSTNWQVITNFQIYGAAQEDFEGCWRYLAATTTIEQNGGYLEKSEIADVLEFVSQTSTKWSNIYDLTSKDISIFIEKNYAKEYTFSFYETYQ